MAFFRSYMKIVNRYPFSSQVLQTGILMTGGDILCQTVVEKKKITETDKIRTTHFAILGCFLVGPALTTWYAYLNRIFVVKPGGSRTKMALQKMFCDQLLFAPVLCTSILVSLNVLREKPIKENIENVKRTAPDVILANYKVWPLVQIINFFFLPLNLQVVFVQCVALGWNTYISYKTSTEKALISN